MIFSLTVVYAEEDEVYADSPKSLTRARRKELKQIAIDDTVRLWITDKNGNIPLFNLDKEIQEPSFYLLCVHDVYVDRYKKVYDNMEELKKLYRIVDSLCSLLHSVDDDEFRGRCYTAFFSLKKNLERRIINLNQINEIINN